MTPLRPGWNWQMLLALMAAALLLSVGVLMARYEEQLYADQELKDVSEQAQILSASVTAALVFDDRAAAQEYVDALKVNPQLQAAGIYDGKRLVASFSRSGGALPILGVPVTQGFFGDSLAVAEPVSQSGHVIGTVYLRANAEAAGRRLARYAGFVLLVTMGALVIAVLSVSQAALTRRAGQLSELNARLYAEMGERQKTEEVLRQSQKMEAVGQLSGGIAHDFNNLIMIVKGNLRLLQRKLGQGESERAALAGPYIVSAEEALDRAAHLTQRILAFSRRQPLTPKSVRLNELVAGMSELIRHSVGEKVEIETSLAAHWWTRCDINQMENVILNLAINARDAMPEGGTLSIETRDLTLRTPPPEVEDFVPGDYVALTVRDTGQGMSEEVRRRAVDPFFTTKPLGKGTGLGLSMTFGYVRQSNGYLSIESAPKRGTAITIFMPRAQEET
jgi:signal transduction histidine kinase